MARQHYDELLSQLDHSVVSMGDVVEGAIGRCVDALSRHDVQEAMQLIEDDSLIDARRYAIERDALLLIATQQPLAIDLRVIAAVLTIATELERIGDYCEGIARLTLRMAAEPVSPDLQEIHTMARMTQELLANAMQAFRERNVDLAGKVWTQDDDVDALYESVFRTLLSEMASDSARVRGDTYLLWIAHNMERMADRVTNIAERVAFIATGDIAGFREGLRSRTVPG